VPPRPCWSISGRRGAAPARPSRRSSRNWRRNSPASCGSPRSISTRTTRSAAGTWHPRHSTMLLFKNGKLIEANRGHAAQSRAEGETSGAGLICQQPVGLSNWSSVVGKYFGVRRNGAVSESLPNEKDCGLFETSPVMSSGNATKKLTTTLFVTSIATPRCSSHRICLVSGTSAGAAWCRCRWSGRS